MKPRHAAALALVGWYLLVPVGDGSQPFRDWSHVGSYDTAKECEDAQLEFVNGAKGPHFVQHGTMTRERVIEGFTLSECIASDDPRLKEK
jgi:hypothetical protein